MRTSVRTFSKDILRALQLLWKADKPSAIINIALQVAQAVLPVCALYCIKLLIEAVVKHNHSFNTIIPTIIALGVILILQSLANQYASYISIIHQQKITDYLSEEVLHKAIEADYEYYENPQYHDTLHLAQQQSLYRFPQLLNNFSTAVQSALSLLFLLGFFFSIQSLFALLFLIVCIPLATIKWYYGYELFRLEKKFAPKEREATYLYQILTNVTFAKEVRIFGYGNTFIQKFRNIRSYIHDEKKKLHLKLTIYSLLAELLEIAAMIILFYFLAKQTWQQTITVGVFVIYIQGFQRLQNVSKNFLQSLVQIFQQRLFLKDLFVFFDIAQQHQPTRNLSFPVVQQGLSVNHVSFGYPQTNKIVLHDISIHCKPGKIIAIVGENGSGKSTLVKLLAGLYELQSGSIKIDEIPLKDIDKSSFRNNTIFVFQDFEKYFFTVEENIALGEDGTTNRSANIEKAATLSGAHEFITKLSKGYKTRMGRIFEGSEQLSGGQWQKLALARIFYKDAQLVVLDEPTSALDATAEFELYENVKEHLKDKMIILISHRLYNLKIADHIYMMQNGSIEEEGSFKELIGKEGTFKKMYDAQKL